MIVVFITFRDHPSPHHGLKTANLRRIFHFPCSHVIFKLTERLHSHSYTLKICKIFCPLKVSTHMVSTQKQPIKIFVIDLASQPFLGRHLYITTFFILAILHRAAPFFTARLFLSGLISHLFVN